MAKIAAYRFPCVPDLSMPKYFESGFNGSSLQEYVAGAAYEFTRLLSAFFPPEQLTVTLRFSFDPRDKQGSPLQIYLLVRLDDEIAVRWGERLLQAERLINAVLNMEHPLQPVAIGTVARLVELCSETAWLCFRDTIERIDAQDPYRVCNYFCHSLSPSPSCTSFSWDDFFSFLTDPTVVDVALFRLGSANNLHDNITQELKRLGELVNVQNTRFFAQQPSKTEGEALEDKRSMIAESLRDKWSGLLERLQQGPVFGFNIRLAGGDGCFDAARLLATMLSSEESFTAISGKKQLDVPLKNAMISGNHLKYHKIYKKHDCYTDAFWLLDEKLKLMDADDPKTKTWELFPEDIPRWYQLSRLKHVLPSDSAKSLFRIPVSTSGFLKTCQVESEYIYSKSSESGSTKSKAIAIGTSVRQGRNALISLNQINKHLFIAGVTGSGKSTTLFEILLQLTELGIPFLVIEPSKKEYRKLLQHPLLKNRLRVFTCGNDKLNPLKLNPFVFNSKEISLDEHLGMLEACFKGALPLFSPLTEIILETLELAYRNRGWQTTDDQSRCTFPQMRDLSIVLKMVLKDFKYSDRIAMDITTAARVRLTNLVRRSVGKIFDAATSLPDIETLMANPTVVELDRLNQEHANLVSLFLLQGIKQYLSSTPTTGGLRHVLVVEEAHNIIGTSRASGQQENSADPRAEAAAFMVRLLAEVRALGQGIIIADQTPAAVAPEVLKNTGVKIVHRTVDGEDRDCLAEAMLLMPGQKDELARLQAGYGFLYHEEMYRPQLIRVSLSRSMVKQSELTHETDTARKDDLEAEERRFLPDVSDRQLATLLNQTDWYQGSVAELMQAAEVQESIIEEKFHQQLAAYEQALAVWKDADPILKKRRARNEVLRVRIRLEEEMTGTANRKCIQQVLRKRDGRYEFSFET